MIPLGELAFQFLKRCEEKGAQILVSDAVIVELKTYLSDEKVGQLFTPFQGIIRNIVATKAQVIEARGEWLKRNKDLPFKDVLHAVLAKHHEAVVITRDKHFFEELSAIAASEKPEDATLD